MPSYRTVQVKEFSTDFRAATEIVDVIDLPVAVEGHVVVKNHFLGINATEINITSGAYGARPLPYTCGLESVGEITSVGENVEGLAIGDFVGVQMVGSFAEYILVPVESMVKLESPDPSMLPIVGCGLAAFIALEQAGEMKSGETILITSAAGATGQLAVQLAKSAGNHVIATCSSDEKVDVLKRLGADRVVNYEKENLSDVLKTEFPRGVDIVFETMGGDMFKTAVENIAVHGRIIIFGIIGGYKTQQTGFKAYDASEVNLTLLVRGASIRGFMMPTVPKEIASAYVERLFILAKEGKIKSIVDPTPFIGLESIADAVEYMYARKNIGKLVIKLV